MEEPADLIWALVIWPAAVVILCKSLICSMSSLLVCRSFSSSVSINMMENARILAASVEQ
jgi:hypothetical protein